MQDLQILGLKDKEYARESDKPLWGVDHLNVSYADLTPFWGLISADRKDAVSLSTIQSEKLYLPGYSWLGITGSPMGQNLPAIDGPADTLRSVYDLRAPFAQIFTDYTGKSNIAMLAKWQKYSRAVNTTSMIINLIWTDIIANSVLGTRGWIPSPAYPSKSSDPVPDYGPAMVSVTVYEHHIQYNWLFFIPAGIVLFCLLLASITALVLALLGRARPARVRHFLIHTSSGRIITNFLYPGVCNSDARTRTWIDSVGGREIRLNSDLASGGAVAASSSSSPGEKASLLPNPEFESQPQKAGAVASTQEAA